MPLRGIDKLQQLTQALAAEPYSEVDELFATSPALLVILDGDAEKFKKVSVSWTTKLGWSSEELRSVQFWNFIHPDDLDSSREIWAKALAGNPIGEFKNRYRTKSAEYVTIVWAFSGFKDGVSFSVCHVERVL